MCDRVQKCNWFCTRFCTSAGCAMRVQRKIQHTSVWIKWILRNVKRWHLIKTRRSLHNQNMMLFDEMKWTNKNVPKHCQMAKMKDNKNISPYDNWQANKIMVLQFSLKKYLDIYHFHCQFPSLYWNKIKIIGIKWTKTVAKKIVKWQKMKADAWA